MVIHRYYSLDTLIKVSSSSSSSTKRLKKKSGTSIIARFGDNSDSTILKFLKFLTKLLGQAIPYSAAIIEVWLDRTFVYFNCSVH